MGAANLCARAEERVGLVEERAPIPGTRRLARVDENTAADGIELSADQLDRLNALEPAACSPPRLRGPTGLRAQRRTRVSGMEPPR